MADSRKPTESDWEQWATSLARGLDPAKAAANLGLTSTSFKRADRARHKRLLDARGREPEADVSGPVNEGQDLSTTSLPSESPGPSAGVSSRENGECTPEGGDELRGTGADMPQDDGNRAEVQGPTANGSSPNAHPELGSEREVSSDGESGLLNTGGRRALVRRTLSRDEVLAARELTEGDLPVPMHLGPTCSSCLYPVGDDGLTLQGPGKGHGRPCGECGRRKTRPGNAANLVSMADRTPEERRAIGAKGRQKALETIRKRGSMVTDALAEKVEEQIEAVTKPYFEALKLEVDPGWSPSTKLAFYVEQTTVSEKLANRIEGTPVARQRQVTKDDADLLPTLADTSPAALRAVALALLDAGDDDAVWDADAEDAEWDEAADVDPA